MARPRPTKAGDGIAGTLAAGSDDPVIDLLRTLDTHRDGDLAVVCGESALTYGELRQRSSALARRLIELGVAPDARVAIVADRSPDTVVGIVAIIKAGGAYVPIDPDYPKDLIAFTLTDSGARVLLTSRRHAHSLPKGGPQIAFLDECGTADTGFASPLGKNLAYVIYTSGSTGRPKGVPITHANLAHSTRARLEFYKIPPKRFLLLSSFAFDSSVAGLFWTLCTGGTLVLPAAGEERDPTALGALIEKKAITHTLCLPSLYALLLGTRTDFTSLETVVVAGEACPSGLPERHASLCPGALLYNEYGPTEATVWSSACELNPTGPITIGYPIPGTSIRIVDEAGKPVAAGASGEIHIGGPGVAGGYFNQPTLTADRFYRDESDTPFYRTGDLARLLPDGALEFLGRADHQVKVRGYRIELGAIESVLQTHPSVRQSVVLAIGDVPGDRRLIAYVAPASCPISELRTLLAEKLPAFMQPAAFVALDTFPLMPNGKVDRAALPAPSRQRPELASTFADARTALERHLAEEWCASLQLDRVGIHDKFFELGGDSLCAAQLIHRLQQRLGEPIFVVALFEAPTVAQLAAFLRKHYPGAVERAFGETQTTSKSPASPITPATLARVQSQIPLRKKDLTPPPNRRNRRVIFIVAPPRSGTTLLRAMLAQHPGLATTSELRLLSFDTLAERHAAYSGAQSIWQRGPLDALKLARGCDEAEAARIMQECEERGGTVADFYGLLQDAVAPRELVDKSPSYALDPAALRHAESIFEDAFYIHLARHPYEMIRSFAGRRMDRVYLPEADDLSPLEAGETVWLLAHRNLLEFLATIPATRQHPLRFTDLVTDPRGSMESLSNALGIAFDPRTLDPYKEMRPTGPTNVHTSDDPRFIEHSKIDASMAEGWRGVIEDNFLSDLSWDLARRLGYEKPRELIADVRPTGASIDPICVIGMAGRFPGARNVDEFWQNLCDGIESIRPLTPDELRSSGIDPAIIDDPNYVNAGAVLEDADQFAASFFGYTPREAELMDPQQRIFLECAWEAFEHAGCDVERFGDPVGVYAGIALNSYFQNNLATRPELAPQLGHYSLTVGNEKDFVATRVAHKLHLKGPAISVQTACSSSLVALHLACQSLRAGEIGLALVGGGRVRSPLHAGYIYVDGGIPSPDGHCRAFDAKARGCVAASGIATVVLKRLGDAQRDGDHIFAVIKSTAINNDGGDKAGFTAPGVEGQAEVIARAHSAAGITADTISYVEAHGTGTSLGDPIEIAALTRAFHATSSRIAHCRIGSVKTNIGHLDAGAGVAGLIKTVLALDREVIPPSLHFQTPNPQIDFSRSPFVVNDALTAWPRGLERRRAGVSSFGIGGTNAHTIVEEASPAAPSSPSRPWQLLILSAKTPTALDRAAANLARHLRANPDVSLADVAHTLQTGRREFQHRRIVVARDTADAADALEKNAARQVASAFATAANPPLVFMFPGQGAQFPGMARELFETEPVFRAALLQCAALLKPHLDLLGALYPGDAKDETMTQTAIAQPAIFSVEYAMAKLWESWGVRPTAFVGHSVGEFTAACLAEVFTLDDALTLLAGRARLMQSVPAGAMLAVRLPEPELRSRLSADVEVAAINSPRLSVVSGPREAIARFAEKLNDDGVACAPLHTSHAFHSAMMEPVLAPFTALAQGVRLTGPRIPIISTLTGGAGANVATPDYWARQLREPVRFADAVHAVAQEAVLLEVGPGCTLAPLARQTRGGTVISSQSSAPGSEQAAMLEALGRLWLAGVRIDWSRIRHGERRLRVPLPTYPFERERFWIAPGQIERAAPATHAEPPKITAASDAEGNTTLDQLRTLLHAMSGVPIERMRADASLLELGFDSLFLTQVALALRKQFRVEIAFRQLFEELATLSALAAHLSASDHPSQPPAPANEQVNFGPFRPIQKDSHEQLDPRQETHLDALISRYTDRTAKSKQLARETRCHFADPRSVSGFRAYWKELVYPIAIERSAGAKLWDVDGHEYVDFTMGFGTNILGHSPPFITEAIAAQLARGIEIGPQSPVAGKVAALLCEFSGMDRAAFCNTGSEAVVAAVRVARTVTGRARIATCSGYHGINDEFLVRAKTVGGERRSVPIAPGIPDHIAKEVLAVEYGAPESLEIIRAHAHELAAVLVEPVQSRHPDLQPREFLLELRKITRDAGVALVFDEVITGFRCHPGGAQAWFGIRADMVTYGKIVGGGMPIGALCGRAAYMDALDGGAWNFGDTSRPETGVTFFAGTYVRHPLAMAASHAMLSFLRDQGGGLQERLNERTAGLIATLNSIASKHAAPIWIESFSSMFIVKFEADFRFGGMLFFHLREKGIHAWDNRLFFLSTAHSDEDLALLIRCFEESVEELKQGGFFKAANATAAAPAAPIPMRSEAVKSPPIAAEAPEAARPLQFSLYFFGNYPAPHRPDKYDLIIESTRFADRNGFTAVWLPERHFHSVGGFSPNAAVMAAALARETSRISLRAGSVVLPLHHPIRVAEEWSLVDNLSNGRVGISIASGWHPNDFVFAPDAYDRRRELSTESLATIRKLWRGETITARGGAGDELRVSIFPLPVQPELPVWATCVQSESYVKAGEQGLNVLAQLQNQSFDDVAAKIRLYRAARTRAGHDRGHVTMLVHTFLAENADAARALAREPLREYLRSHVEISQRKLASQNGAAEVSRTDLDYLLTRAADGYAEGKTFIGTVESSADIAEKLRSIGVDEVGCLIDFGIAQETVISSLPRLDALRRRFDDSAHTIPLTDAQRGLCMLAAFHPDASRSYNETSALAFRGPLDVDRLRHALASLIERHEALRTTIADDGETQTVHPKAALDLAVVDAAEDGAIESCISEIRAMEFDFSRAPIMDARLLRIRPDEHVLVLTLHHLLANGPSYGVLMDELCELYSGGTHLPRAMQLSEFVIARGKFETEIAKGFWIGQFANLPPSLALPLDHPRPASRTFRGGRAGMRFDRESTAALRQTGAKHGASLFVSLLSAFQTLLHRLSGQDALVVGVPFEGSTRTLPGGDRLIANTTNVAPLRIRVDSEMRFTDLLSANRALVLAANEHQEYFFGHLVRDLALPLDTSRPPLFSVFFNYENGGFHREVDGITVDLVNERAPFLQVRDTAMSEIYLNVSEQNGTLFFRCDYNRDLFAPETIERWLGHLETLLKAVTLDPTIPVRRVALLSDAERNALLPTLATAHDEPPSESLSARFSRQARVAPDAIAVTFNTATLTYAELDSMAAELAGHLRDLGVGRDVIVGLRMERSAELIVGLLAIIKAGGAYLPIDLAYPTERVAFMLSDSQAPVLLTQSHLANSVPDSLARVVCIDRYEAPTHPTISPDTVPDDLAYVIYTSGSTGQPKGCCITHRNVTRLFETTSGWFHFGARDVWTMFHSVAFDFSVWEIWGALLHGGRLVVVPHDISRSPDAFHSLLVRERVTVLNQTPSAFRPLIAADATGGSLSLRLIIFGGEALDMRALGPWFARHGDARPQLVNMYGITETTVHVTYRPLTARDVESSSVIGVPLPDLKLYLLDRDLEPVPIGVAGEIFVAGPGLARGYLHRPELTTERFIPDPHHTGERLYKTGDLARRLPDGDLEYLGRIDQQVKVRGFRIELGEIQAVLTEHPGVQESIVIARLEPDGATKLIAYFVPGEPVAEARELRNHLRARLPDYMVPAIFFRIERVPLTPNGKLDPSALPNAEAAAELDPSGFVAPRDEAEQHVAEVWRSVLKIPRVGIHDDFFELGGHSLSAMQVVSRLRSSLFPQARVPDLFEHTTVASLVSKLRTEAPREEGVL